MRDGNFAASSISSTNIDCLVKVDVKRLMASGLANPPSQVNGVVDKRSVKEILAADDENSPIRIFALPDGWYAQECSFVPRKHGISEDDGWLVTYVFDESQLDDKAEAPSNSKSELWVIDAKEMKDVVARIVLPQRVPYGMHGNWFSEEQILNQRGFRGFRAN